jgi:hypothetical protein
MSQSRRYNGFQLRAYGQPIGEGKFCPTVILTRQRATLTRERKFEVPGRTACDSEVEAELIAAKYGRDIVDGNVKGVDPWQVR